MNRRDVTSNTFNKSNAYLPKAKVCKPPPPPPPPPPPSVPVCELRFDPDTIPIEDSTSGEWIACLPSLPEGEEVTVYIEEPPGCTWVEEPEAGNCEPGGGSLITGAESGDFEVTAVFTFSDASECSATASLHITEE